MDPVILVKSLAERRVKLIGVQECEAASSEEHDEEEWEDGDGDDDDNDEMFSLHKASESITHELSYPLNDSSSTPSFPSQKLFKASDLFGSVLQEQATATLKPEVVKPLEEMKKSETKSKFTTNTKCT